MRQETEPDDAPWGPIANRGELTATIVTRAGAEQHGIPTHRDAELVLVLHPDGASIVPVSCVSIADALTLIREIAPRSVDVEVGRFEDRAPLVALLERDGGPLH